MDIEKNTYGGKIVPPEQKIEDASSIRVATVSSIDRTVQETSEAARIKFSKPEYNNINRALFYDDKSARDTYKNHVFENKDKVLDRYTGKELCLKQADAKKLWGDAWQEHVAETDHIDPLDNFVNRHRENPFITSNDLKEVGNADANYQILSRKLNQTSKNAGKGGSTQQEWADDNQRMQGIVELKETNEPIKKIRQRIRYDGEKAKAINDSRVKNRTISNTVKTGHNAGIQGAQNAGITALTMSSIMNIVSVISGEKTAEEAAADVAIASGTAAVAGYVAAGTLTVFKQSLVNSSSNIVQALRDSNVPGKVVTATVETFSTLGKWTDDKISTQECLMNIEEKGINIATMGYSMAVGRTIIPIPVVGEAVGAAVGSLLTSFYFQSRINQLQDMEDAHIYRLNLIKECRAAEIQWRRFNRELESYLFGFSQENREYIFAAISSMDIAWGLEDWEGVMAGANDITRKLGGDVNYETFDDFIGYIKEDNVDIL